MSGRAANTMLFSYLLSLFLPTLAAAEIRLIGKTTIPANTTDLSPLNGRDGSTINRFGGISAISYTGKDNLYALLPDRGPKDGQFSYLCRFHTMTITVEAGSIKTKLISTTFLRDEQSRPLTGFLGALTPTDKVGTRLDPEGMRVSPRGTIYVSDEYGPSVGEFDLQGKRIRQLPVPSYYQISQPDADPEKERKNNSVGREPNRGMEGLALTPDGSKLMGCMQGPLLQDGGRHGINLRLLEIDLASSKMREFIYPLHDTSTCVSEILAVNSQEYLVLERESQGGVKKPFHKIFKIDVSRATDIHGREKLPAKGVPNGVVTTSKELFLDLHDPRFGFKPGEVPVKVEGVTFGPDLPDGRRLLLVTTDNDFRDEEPTRIFAFAFDRNDLPNLK